MSEQNNASRCSRHLIDSIECMIRSEMVRMGLNVNESAFSEMQLYVDSDGCVSGNLARQIASAVMRSDFSALDDEQRYCKYLKERYATLGYTDFFRQNDTVWGFPPNGVMPLDLKDLYHDEEDD